MIKVFGLIIADNHLIGRYDFVRVLRESLSKSRAFPCLERATESSLDYPTEEKFLLMPMTDYPYRHLRIVFRSNVAQSTRHGVANRLISSIHTVRYWSSHRADNQDCRPPVFSHNHGTPGRGHCLHPNDAEEKEGAHSLGAISSIAA